MARYSRSSFMLLICMHLSPYLPSQDHYQNQNHQGKGNDPFSPSPVLQLTCSRLMVGGFFSFLCFIWGGVGKDSPYAHMAAAAVGETVACVVRVPTENVKQKMQVGVYKTVKSGVSGIMETQGYVSHTCRISVNIHYSAL